MQYFATWFWWLDNSIIVAPQHLCFSGIGGGHDRSSMQRWQDRGIPPWWIHLLCPAAIITAETQGAIVLFSCENFVISCLTIPDQYSIRFFFSLSYCTVSLCERQKLNRLFSHHLKKDWNRNWETRTRISSSPCRGQLHSNTVGCISDLKSLKVFRLPGLKIPSISVVFLQVGAEFSFGLIHPKNKTKFQERSSALR